MVAAPASAAPAKPLPGPKEQLVKTLNDVVAKEKEPGLTPAVAVSEPVPTPTDATSSGEAAAPADAAAAPIDSTGCVR
ncbi:MAG TPA: hypothetical protein VLA55_11585, partial [Ornithinibacter sp.]|nr:hypothetical protein [Ornithinibacter sp.]